DDADLGGGKEHEAVVGHAARQQPGLPAVEHDAPAHEPGAVLAAARERPAAGHPVAAVDHRRPAERGEGAAAHDLRLAAVDLPGRVVGEVGARHAARGADHRRPAGGTVGGRDDLDGPDHGRRVDLAPAGAGVPPVSRAEAERRLRETPGWTLDADATRIERTFKTADFAAALALVEQIAAIAEAEGHHPDIGFGWGYCRVVFYTHKIKGLHENDFIMAAKVNALAGASRAAASHG